MFSKFDQDLDFPRDQPVLVDGTTAAILKSSRFKKEFTFGEAPCCAQVKEVRKMFFNNI